MGLFSFGNKEDAAPSRRGRAPAVAQRSSARARGAERRGDQETLLDPTLPEKQRARRRLIGAIALVVAAVVVLPMVLDSHPKPVTDDIAIRIPNRDAPAAARPASAAGRDNSVAAAPDETQQTAAATAKSNSAPRPRPAPSANTANVNAPPAAALPAPPGSRFVVQIGAFPSEERARAWVAKLKAAGVPVYTEHRKLADGSERVLLRAGPFTDRASAESAVKKVRAAGLLARSSDSRAATKPAQAQPARNAAR
jgi:DedD protein